MTLPFLIELKNKNNNLINQLTDNINSYNEIINLIDENDENNNFKKISLNYQKSIKDQTSEIKYLFFFQNTIISKIQTLCDHTFEYDLIDITPDTSKPIFYCTKCEYIK